METGKSRVSCTEKKLSTEEFIQLIPRLELKQLYEIEIKINNKWEHLFNPHFMMGIHCTLCDLEMSTKDLKNHFQQNSHLNALRKVAKFYHPLYTASKYKESLENNENEAALARHDSGPIMNYNRFGKESCNSNDITQKTMSPEDLMEIEFKNREKDKWQKMISTIGLISDRGKYHCRICNKDCSGIVTVNAHIGGNSHRIMQKSAFAVRSLKYKDVTKHTIISLERKEGLIGVEYVLKLENSDRYGDYMFACCLCNFVQIPTEELMENHIIGFSHRLKYCELHYEDTIKHFQRMISSKRKLKYTTAMEFMLGRMANGIEEYHGYGKPTITDYNDFMQDKQKVGDEVFGIPHACQKFGPSFSNVVTMEDLINTALDVNKASQALKKFTRPRFMEQPPGIYYLNMRIQLSRNIKNEDHKVSSHNRKEESHKRSLSVRQETSNTKSRSISPLYSRKRKISSPVIGRQIKCETDIWSTYRQLISKAAEELEAVYQNVYHKKPERHPSYDKEWRTFWKRRKAELKRAGKDYLAYDFQSEWTIYFSKRIDELFGEDLHKSQIDIRRQLNIPVDAKEDSRIVSSSNEQLHKIQPLLSIKIDPESINIKTRKAPIKRESATTLENENSNVMHILRLLTALEEHLGSVGSKILDLLTTALSMEKTYAGDLEQLEQNILNSNNCKILKAAQEKLKSQIYADLVEEKLIYNFNRVIEGTERLLSRAEKMGWSSVNESNTISSVTDIAIEELLQKSPSDTFKEQTPNKEIVHFTNTFDKPIQSNQYYHNMDKFVNNLTNVHDLTKQNTPFSQENTFPIKNSNVIPSNGINFNADHSNFDTVLQQRNNAAFWDRLDGHHSVPKRNRKQ